MSIEKHASKLITYLESISDFTIVDYIDGNYGHMGATIADAILQAGINYDTVVRPRIHKILEKYPDTKTTSDLWHLILHEGIKNILVWKDDDKPNRAIALTELFMSEGIET